jgi:hypothetical protein
VPRQDTGGEGDCLHRDRDHDEPGGAEAEVRQVAEATAQDCSDSDRNQDGEPENH